MDKTNAHAEELQARLDELIVWRLDQFCLLNARQVLSKTPEEWGEITGQACRINALYRQKVAATYEALGIPLERDENAEAFHARIDEIGKWSDEQLSQIDKLQCSDEERLQALDQQLDAYEAKVAQAHRDFGIPYLQSWSEVLSAADKAEYRAQSLYPEAQSLYPEQSIQASLQRDETGSIILTMTEHFKFPATWDLYDRLPDTYIRSRLPGDCWIAPETKSEGARGTK